MRRAVDARPDTPASAPLTRLTEREQDVLELVAAGLSNAEIAERLHIGVSSVKTHITNLMTKTGSPNRVRLALSYLRGSSPH